MKTTNRTTVTTRIFPKPRTQNCQNYVKVLGNYEETQNNLQKREMTIVQKKKNTNEFLTPSLLRKVSEAVLALLKVKEMF